MRIGEFIVRSDGLQYVIAKPTRTGTGTGVTAFPDIRQVKPRI